MDGLSRFNRKVSKAPAIKAFMFVYATDETAMLMPLPTALAHRLGQMLARDRHAGVEPWLSVR